MAAPHNKVDPGSVIMWYAKHPDQKVTSEDIRKFAKLTSVRPLDEKKYIVGGAAVQLLGSNRITRDVDMVFDNQQAMEKTIAGLLHLENDDIKGGFVRNPSSGGVYWYNKTKFDKVVLFDMHTAAQGLPPYPTMPSVEVHTIDGVSVAPTLLILCYKLIAWTSHLRTPEKKATDLADIHFLLTLPEIIHLDVITPAGHRPSWLTSPAGVQVYNQARAVWQAHHAAFGTFNAAKIF